jgi:excisionase family DNA binding protein
MTTSSEVRAYLSVQEVAAELGICTGTVYRLVDRGDLPAFKTGPATNSRVRIPRAALEAWLWSEGEGECRG